MMPVSKYFRKIISTRMKIRIQIGISTGGDAKFLTGVTHQPIYDRDGVVCAIYPDENGGAFNKDQSYFFESRAYRSEIEGLNDDARRMNLTDDVHNLLMREVLAWRESGRQYHGKLL